MLLVDLCNRPLTRAPVGRLAPGSRGRCRPAADGATDRGPCCVDARPSNAPRAFQHASQWPGPRWVALDGAGPTSPCRLLLLDAPEGVVERVTRDELTSSPRRCRPRTRLTTGDRRFPSRRSARAPSRAVASPTVGPPPPRSRQRARLPWPETPSIDRCTQGPALTGPFLRVPATVLSALPPMNRLPTLLRSFALSLEGARREDISASSSLVVASPRAPPERLLQPNTTRDHDRWIALTSRTPAAVARDESCFSHTSREGGSGVRVAVLRGTASRGFTGQGPRSGCSPRLRRLPLRSLASESFAPTRSTRTPPVAARDAAGWRGLQRADARGAGLMSSPGAGRIATRTPSHATRLPRG
jgi:hypothetical protein